MFARVSNETEQPVEVRERVSRISWARLLTLKWGSLDVPATVGPGESWAGAAGWSPLSLRRRIRGELIVDGEELAVEFSPPIDRPWSWRAGLRRIDLNRAVVLLVVAFGIANAALTDWHGLGFLGIGLAVLGTMAAARGALFERAGFASDGSRGLLLVGVAGVIAGSVTTATHGFGWLGSGALLATVLFAMQRGFVSAGSVRKRRARNVVATTAGPGRRPPSAAGVDATSRRIDQ